MRTLLKRLIGGVAALAAAAPAFSQCAMCRTVAAAQGDEAASTLNFAIIILMLPAMGMRRIIASMIVSKNLRIPVRTNIPSRKIDASTRRQPMR